MGDIRYSFRSQPTLIKDIMKYIFPPLAGLIVTILNLVCPFIVPFAICFAKWDDKPSTGSYGIGNVIRGDLPNWLSWFSTPDERLPGGMYEPTVANMHQKYGRFITSCYWLGVRNCLMGMSKALGKPTTDYAPEDNGFWKRDDIWRYTLTLGPIRIIVGYQVYKLLDGSFYAYPCFTAKRS